MLIDDFDIATRKARVISTIVGNSEIKSKSDWSRGSPEPTMLPGETGFKKLKQTLVIKGNDREEMLLNRSDILAQLTVPRHLQIPGFTHRFHVSMTKHSADEKSKQFHTLDLEYDAYEYAETVTVNDSEKTEVTVINPGNVEAPAILEITPTMGNAKLTITGLFRDPITKEEDTATIAELTTGKTIVIDGETGAITEDGESRYKSGDEIWTPPSLMPGTNKITFNTKSVGVKIKFKPRFF